MAGIHLLQRFDKDTLRARAELDGSLNRFGLSGDVTRVLYEDKGAVFALRGYEAYPVSVYEENGRTVILEGMVYGQPADRLRAAALDLADRAFSPATDPAALGDILWGLDGEYVFWMHDSATGRVAVLNDPFACLPILYRVEADFAAVSRQAPALLYSGPPLSIDSLGLAQRLSLGQALEGRTIWREIRGLLPANLLIIDPASGRSSVTRVHTFDYGQRRHRGVAVEENAARLVDLFTRACRVRAERGPLNLVSLSGGLDSRTVSAGLSAAGAVFECATFSKSGYNTDQEARAAEKVAAVFGRPWRLIEVGGMKCRGALDLLRLRGGRNFLWMSFILDFYENLRQTFGSDLTHYTGDGGDFLIPDMRPARRVSGLDELVEWLGDYNFFTNYCLKYEDVAKLTGVGLDELRQSVRGAMEAYGESSMNDKFIHYTMDEEFTNIYHEGQDRNRCFFWSTSPFFSPEFYEYAYNVPQEQKSGFDLYRRVLAAFSPEAARIEYGDYVLGTTRFLLDYKKFRLKKGRPRLTKFLKHLIKGEDVFSADSVVTGIFHRQVENHPGLAEALDADVLKFLVSPEGRYHRFNVLHLLTVTSVIEDVLRGRSSFEDDPEGVLI